MEWRSSSLTPNNSTTPISATPLTPFSLTIVVRDLGSREKAQHLDAIRGFCADHGIRAETRVYDSTQRHDREYVAELPALHLYKAGIHVGCFYPDRRPFQILSDALDAWKKDEMKKAARARPFSIVRNWWLTLRSRLHRKSRLEEAEVEKLKYMEKKRSKGF